MLRRVLYLRSIVGEAFLTGPTPPLFRLHRLPYLWSRSSFDLFATLANNQSSDVYLGLSSPQDRPNLGRNYCTITTEVSAVTSLSMAGSPAPGVPFQTSEVLAVPVPAAGLPAREAAAGSTG